jgi:hypothetical protein
MGESDAALIVAVVCLCTAGGFVIQLMIAGAVMEGLKRIETAIMAGIAHEERDEP